MIDVYHFYRHLTVSVDSFIVDMRLIQFDGRVQVVSGFQPMIGDPLFIAFRQGTGRFFL